MYYGRGCWCSVSAVAMVVFVGVRMAYQVPGYIMVVRRKPLLAILVAFRIQIPGVGYLLYRFTTCIDS